MKRFLTAFIIAAFLICPLLATDYYVKPDGNDELDGLSVGNAWATIGKANVTLTAGNTVYILDGTYTAAIDPTNSGTSGNPITYQNYVGHSPLITGYSTLTGWTQYNGEIYRTTAPGGGYGLFEDDWATAGKYVALSDGPGISDPDTLARGEFYLDGYLYARCSDGADPDTHTMRWTTGRGADLNDDDYITIDGITMQYVMRGINAESCDNCIFQNCTIEYTYANAVSLWSSPCTYNTVQGNTINYAGSWYRDEGDGVHIGSTSHHNLIEGNIITRAAHASISSYGAGSSPKHNIIQNNDCSYGGSSGLNANVYPYSEVWRWNKSYYMTGCGIQTDSSDNLWLGNENWHNGWEEDADSESICIYATGATDTKDNIFVHNVFYDGMNATLGIDEFYGMIVDDNIFKNNIFFRDDANEEIWVAVLRSNVFAYNCIYDTDHINANSIADGLNSLTWYEANRSSNFNNNVQADPEFISPDGSPPDFHLQATSDCINAADWLTTITSANGSGTEFVVDDARYFIDGYGITTGDTIYLEGSDSALITDVNYGTNTITVNSSVSWTQGDGVTLVDFVTAPDIGAYEYGGADIDIEVIPLVLANSMIVPVVSVGTGEGGPWLTGWSYRKKITVQNANITSDLTWFPLYVPIDADADLHEALATGYDIRFTEDDGTTLIPYERVYWTGGNGSAATAEFYVGKTGMVWTAASSTDIYMYYGNAGASDGEDATAVWDANHVLVTHTDDLTTSTLSDTIGVNTLTKAAANEPVEAAGKVYKSQDFDATDDDVECGSDASIDNIWTGGGTISWWQYADTIGESNYGNLFWKGTEVNELFYNASTVFRFEVTFGTSHGAWHFTVGTGAWHHVAIAYNWSSVDNNPVVYVDGSSVSVTEDSTPSGTVPDDSAQTLYLGGNGSGAYTWDGHIEEFRMSTTERPAEWIKFLHANHNEGDNELTWGSEEAQSSSVEVSPTVVSLLVVVPTAVATGGGNQPDFPNIYVDAGCAGTHVGSEASPYSNLADINWTTGGDNSVFDAVAANEDVIIYLKRGLGNWGT